ncbi:alpha-L-rhamnosidase [Lachnoclostridium sp. Marseille-P6806]|uniref:alpha-L-rhamnosidase n=1 Tax=Lachnoclostridium sp. Marseille-P6806 TaxID=2364793 RepID=UPI00102FB5E4|nr:alpha-L-rhamnosidase [Lachnoclostridium sp. Marseille-P6806]
MRIVELKTNHMENPVGYALDVLSLSWKVREAAGKKTETVRVLISRDESFAEPVYDSGRRAGVDSASFVPAFTACEGVRYFWKVYVTDDAGDSAESGTAFFERYRAMGEAAKWIRAPFEEGGHAIFMKRFRLDEKPVRARLRITGLGLYEAFLNGERVGEDYLAPFYNDYNHWIQVETYDITEQLEAGDNALGIALGNGWYMGRFGFIDGLDRLYGDTQQLICELTAELPSGEAVVISSDESFCAHRSPMLASSIYDGEEYDARLEAEDFGTARCELSKERGWAAAVPAGEELTARLSARRSLPLVVHERLAPVELIRTAAGETVLDFGQEMTGLISFVCREKAGTRIHLRFGEILQNGNFYNENLRTAKQELIYYAGGGEKSYTSHFTFYGFRYMKAEGFTQFELSDFTGLVLHSDMPETGRITTDNEKVNRLIQNARWGQKGNFVDVPTDCPQRDERMGWTGDAQAFAATASFNMYTPGFYGKFLYDMRQEQKEDFLAGSVPHVVPDVLDQIGRVMKRRSADQKETDAAEGTLQLPEDGNTPEDGNAPEDGNMPEETDAAAGSCAWGDAATVIPWTMYVFFRDKTRLAEQYENMKLWVDHIHDIDDCFCGGRRLWTHGFHFADWLALDNFHAGSSFGGTDPYYVASAYYLHSAELTARAASVLGCGEDAAYYAGLAGEVREAMRREYFTATGRLAIPTQTALVLALHFGIAPENARERLREDLRRSLEEEKIHLTTGFVGTAYLCRTLSEIGLTEYAYTLLLNEDYPSWLYEVNMGATTVWERWNSVLPDGSISDTGMNSLNHYAYGAVVEWVYRTMGGIHPDEQGGGFRRFRLRPEPDPRFGFCRTEYESVYGTIVSCWETEEDGYTMRLTVPFDTAADFAVCGALQRAEITKAGAEEKEEAAADGETGPAPVPQVLGQGESVLLPAGSYRIRLLR